MKFIGDFHIHSHYSIATSKKLVPEEIALWAKIKGIKVVGTGDFAHPGWTKELKQKLEPAEPGLYKLKKEFLKKEKSPSNVRFILTAEISNIYKKGDKVRKVHNLIFAPDFKTVHEIQSRLAAIGNIESDGRPILGLDSRDLLEIVLESDEDAFLVPAHIWTPWFSALGSKSGFNTIDECYSDLSDSIFAVETGLSSDPPMNWICSFLDKFTLISNSDAHSPQKLGREANLFDTELNYKAIKSAMKDKDPSRFLGTIEFFPQEGKYHFDGHRKCGIRWNPLETIMHNGICPKCGKKVTVGVMNRVAQLADREKPQTNSQQFPFNSLLTLKDILSQIHNVGPNTKTVAKSYNTLLKHFSSEFDLLLNSPIAEIERKSNEVLAEAIRRMRQKEVRVKEGFDGEYGQIKLFAENEINDFKKQKNLFENSEIESKTDVKKLNLINFDIEEFQKLKRKKLLQAQDIDLFENADEKKIVQKATNWLQELNEEQTKAVKHFTGPQLIIAGPGTGKTRVLTNRIKYLILNKKIPPAKIVAITFTNRAAKEMNQRLQKQLTKSDLQQLTISTFHAFGLNLLKKNLKHWDRSDNFSIFDEEDRQLLLQKRLNLLKKEASKFSQKICQFKRNLYTPDDIDTAKFKNIFHKYESQMQLLNAVDIDDLIYKAAMMLKQNNDLLSKLQNKYNWFLIDEYQDINKAQYHLIKLLLKEENPNICAIGDPNQAIYGFRGADVSYIQKFKNDFKDTKVYNLKKSYRCSDKILSASSQVMHHGEYPRKHLLQGLDEGVKLNILVNKTHKEEAERVARTIEDMMGGLRFFSMDSSITQGERTENISDLSDFAVLCRLSRQMQPLEKAFADHSIPYQKIRSLPIFQKPLNKSVIDILKVSRNPKDFLHTEKLMQAKRISMKQLNKLKNIFSEKTVEDILQKIIVTYFKEEQATGKENFKELLQYARDFGTNIDKFINYTAIGTEMDKFKKNVSAVNLMTLHSVKGLEFEAVFIVGCENGLLPYSLFENQQSDPEEERRLFYVGMTRAKHNLFLSYSKNRFLFGKTYELKKSPFLNNIEKDLMIKKKSEFKKKVNKKKFQQSLFD